MATQPKNQTATVNLDTASYEEYEEFSAIVNGRRIVLKSPHELDWTVLLEIDHPIQFLNHVVADEDMDFLRKGKIPAQKFNRLMEDYQKHFGLGDRGKGGASRF
jgi:hypothetical protein